MGRYSATGVYALCHLAVDLGCAYAYFAGCSQGSLGFLLYNFCAFALQMPLGLLADQTGAGRKFALLGCLLVAGMCLLPSFGLLGCLLLGLGNGLFHVGGGLEVLRYAQDRAGPLGLFVSPGALGLSLGAGAGKAGCGPWAPVGLLLASALLLPFLPAPARPPRPLTLPPPSVLPQVLFLALVVVLRSWGGMLGHLPWNTWLLLPAATLAVVLGKAAGGFLCDRLGALPTGLLSLAGAGLLFGLGGSQPVPGLLALFLFQMTMPVTLWALAQRMPGCPAFAFGTLTFALFLGFLPAYLGWEALSPIQLGLLSLASCPLLLLGLRPGVRR